MSLNVQKVNIASDNTWVTILYWWSNPEWSVAANPWSICLAANWVHYRKSTWTWSTWWVSVSWWSVAKWTTTRTTSDVTWTQTIAHWLWVIPKIVSFNFCNNSDTSSTWWVWYGNYNWTTNSCIWLTDLWASAWWAMNTSNCIIYENSSWVWRRATATFDATNITISRNKGWAWTNLDVMREASA